MKRLGDHGRRVLEDRSFEEKTRYPNRLKTRNCRNMLRRLRRDENRRSSRMLIAAGTDQRDGALVVRRVAVFVQPRVKLRSRRKRERE